MCDLLGELGNRVLMFPGDTQIFHIKGKTHSSLSERKFSNLDLSVHLCSSDIWTPPINFLVHILMDVPRMTDGLLNRSVKCIPLGRFVNYFIIQHFYVRHRLERLFYGRSLFFFFFLFVDLRLLGLGNFCFGLALIFIITFVVFFFIIFFDNVEISVPSCCGLELSRHRFAGLRSRKTVNTSAQSEAAHAGVNLLEAVHQIVVSFCCFF
mmetsp:Transcript_47127/g.54314  ORF Transcript_47127/g.54314 Transcript_47127/m.54314 type:complete len:209 (+) Transcript_47127:957-1583(+)